MVDNHATFSNSWYIRAKIILASWHFGIPALHNSQIVIIIATCQNAKYPYPCMYLGILAREYKYL